MFVHIQIDKHDMSKFGLSVISFLNALELISWHISIAIVSTQLNGFNYCYIILIIPFNINHLFEHSGLYTHIAINTNY